MHETRHTFTATMARTALADLEGTFDRALKREITKRQQAALVSLREKSATALRHIAAGRNDRLPAAVLDEVLEGIRSILHPDTKTAIAKHAPNAARLVAGQRVTVAKMPGEMTRHEKDEAFVAIGGEIKALIESYRKAFRKLNAEDALDRFHRDLSKTMVNLAFAGDVLSAKAEMDKAPSRLAAMLDAVRVERAFAEAYRLPSERSGPNGSK